jgi:integrase
MYSIKAKLHPYKNEEKLQRVIIQVIVNRIKITKKTKIAVKQSQFKKDKVTDHPLADKYNYELIKERREIENILFDAFRNQETFTKAELTNLIHKKGQDSKLLADIMQKVLDDYSQKLSKARQRQYEVMIRKVSLYKSNTAIDEVNGPWLLKFENYLRESKISNSTIRANMNVIKTIVRKYNPKVDFTGYANVSFSYKQVEFLLDSEIELFKKALDNFDNKYILYSGHLFLFCCYCGFRIADAMKFNADMIKEDELVLYAAKNKKPCRIPLYKPLETEIEYLLNNPLKLTEKTIRESVHLITKLAGINKHVKFHVSRHTFISRSLNKGMDVFKVADMAGDTVTTILKTYAHVDRGNLKKEVKDRLG